MDLIDSLDTWTYAAIGMLIVSIWMLVHGIAVLKRENPETVDEGKLRNRCYGGIAIAVTYLLCSLNGLY